MFRVSSSNRLESSEFLFFNPFELAIVRENPISSPKFSDEGMGVGKTDFASIGFSNMRNYKLGTDGIRF